MKNKNTMSVKWKVTLWYACMLVLIVLLLFGFIFSVSRRLLEQESAARLEGFVQEFVNEIELDDGFYELDEEQRFYENGVIFSVYDEEGRLVAGSVPAAFPEDTTLKAYTFQTFPNGQETWSVYDAALPYGENRILWVRGILTGENLFFVERTLFAVLLIACPLLIVLALAVGYSITRKAFLPIEEIRQTARAIGAGGDLSARIPLERTQGEIRELAATFNEMFGRLEESFEKERRFTSDASHELRTPAAVITSQAEYALLPDATFEEQREGLQIILEQAGKMSSLISQLLTLARADSGRQQLSFEDTNLSFLAEETLEACREKADRRNIRLISRISPEIHVSADASSLTRALLNLLENAVQYGREGGYVKLELFRLPAQKNAVCRISDDGIGIEKADLPRIWQRFYRADPSRNPEGSNTGLGLPLVKWILEAHQGTIFVESTPGKGSTFTFELPLSS